MKRKFIPVNNTLLEGNEKKYHTECINSGWISSDGHTFKTFEKKLCWINYGTKEMFHGKYGYNII